MAERIFTAPDGTVWQAWSVVPGDHADWPAQARSQLPPSMAEGWLCFESSAGKRRLHPIPPGWEARSDADLWGFCTLADAVRARATSAV